MISKICKNVPSGLSKLFLQNLLKLASPDGRLVAVLEFMVSSLEVMKVAQICDDLQSKAFYGQLNPPNLFEHKKEPYKTNKKRSPSVDLKLILCY